MYLKVFGYRHIFSINYLYIIVFLSVLLITFFAGPTIIASVVGGCLVLLFCVMLFVFMTIRRKKHRKDDSKISKTEKNKNVLPKQGITSINTRIHNSAIIEMLFNYLT